MLAVPARSLMMMMDIVSGCGTTLEELVPKSRKESGQARALERFGVVLGRGG